MATDRDDTDDVFERWERDYVPRAETVGNALAGLFAEAFDPQRLESTPPGDLVDRVGAYVRARRDAFPHRMILFIYSSRFDPAVAKELLDPEVTKAALPPGVTEQQLFEDKAKKLDQVFKAVVLCADQAAGHYTAALMSAGGVPRLPLVWEVPTPDEAVTGFPPEMMWWATFRCLCEISRAIVAYGGPTQAFFSELSHIRQTPHLAKRLVWLDVNVNLFFPDEIEEQWTLPELPAVLKRISD